MPYCLYIPSNSFQIEIKMEKGYGVRQELNRQIDSNLCVLQWALLLQISFKVTNQIAGEMDVIRL